MDKHRSVICFLTLTLCIFVNLHSVLTREPNGTAAVSFVKPGVCPSTTGLIGTCVEGCSSDSDCEMDLKCCSNGCGHLCMQPNRDVSAPKPGFCPSTTDRIGLCAEFCSSDSGCKDDLKCCSNGCGHSCMKPYSVSSDVPKAKPGTCPRPVGFGLCVERCSSDSDCEKDLKCCSNGCGHLCMKPVRVKPGACPRRTWGVGRCAKLCSLDSDCPRDLKCCSNGCGHECMEPYIVKRGRCPRRLSTRMCAEYCYHDGQCPREQKCCRTSCGHACTEV